jgi:hypothetical protein
MNKARRQENRAAENILDVIRELEADGGEGSEAGRGLVLVRRLYLEERRRGTAGRETRPLEAKLDPSLVDTLKSGSLYS